MRNITRDKEQHSGEKVVTYNNYICIWILTTEIIVHLEIDF